MVYADYGTTKAGRIGAALSITVKPARQLLSPPTVDFRPAQLGRIVLFHDDHLWLWF